MRLNAFMGSIVLAASLGALGTTAQANWEFEGGEGATSHVARVCKGNDDVLCFELACNAASPLEFRLSSQNMPDMVAAPKLDALLFVGSQLAGSLQFRQNGLGTFEAPLEETHLRGVQRLKAGLRAQLHVLYGSDTAPEVHRFTLIGSRKAIEAAEAQCAMPDFAARELERRTQVNPAEMILSDMREACTVLDGTLTQGEGFAVPFDVDGKPPMDLRVNHGALVCDSTPDLVCGAAGCLTSLWIGLEDGRYRKAYMNALQDVATTEEPGVLNLTFTGQRCGGEGTEACDQLFQLVDGEIVEVR